MAITFVGYQTASFNSTAGTDQNLSTTLVSGTIQTDDLLIVAMTCGNSGTSTLTVRDTNLTWTSLTHRNQADTVDANLDVAYAFATASTPANILFDNANGGNMGAVLYVFRGVDKTTPLDGVAAVGASAASTTAANPGAITPSSADSVIVTIAAIGHAAGASATSSFTAGPSGYGDFQNLTCRVSTSAFQGSLGLAWKQSTGNTSQDPGVYTASATNAQWCYTCYTISLRMAATTNKTVTADSGSYALTGVAAGLKLGRKVGAGTGSYALTGTDATLSKAANKTIAADAGSYTLTGTVAGLKHAWKVVAASGTYTLTGATASLELGRKVGAGSGSYALAGTAASLDRSWAVAAGAGTYTLTGSAAGTKLGRKVGANAGAYALSGTAATLRKGWKVGAGAGSYTLSGTAAGVLHGWKVTAAVGSYTLTGFDAALTKSGGAKVVTADPGSYALTGVAAGLKHGWKVGASAGSYALTGAAAGLKHGWKVGAAVGSYGLTGTAATLRHGWVVPASAGSYALTGQDAALTKAGGTAKAISAEAGTYALTGTPATLALASNALVGGGHAWKGPAEKEYRVHPDYEDKPKQKKRRKVTEPEVITLAPDLHIQTGIVSVRPAWDVMAEIQQRAAEAERARQERLRAIALADDEWLMVA